MTPADRNTAFFRPLWRRVVLVIVLGLWTAVEVLYGEQLWSIITGGILAYSVWTFFVAFPPEDEQAPGDRK